MLPNCSPTDNPFDASRLRPGAIPFRFRAGESVERLVERFRSLASPAEIIGSHGSGKSSLVATLSAALRRHGDAVLLIELHDGQRSLPRGWHRQVTAKPNVVIVDGYEQLSRIGRLGLAWRCRQRRWGLIVTAHRSVGFPCLYRTEVTAEHARDVIEQFGGEPRLSARELADLLKRHGNNLREVLFELYDRYEANHKA
jgi:hypothetical protein